MYGMQQEWDLPPPDEPEDDACAASSHQAEATLNQRKS